MFTGGVLIYIRVECGSLIGDSMGMAGRRHIDFIHSDF